MNKAELVARIAKDTKMSKSAAEQAVNAFMSNVKGALKKKNNVTLVGFGTWTVAKRKAREGRHPQTGALLKIPAKRVPKFRPGKGLREAV